MNCKQLKIEVKKMSSIKLLESLVKHFHDLEESTIIRAELDIRVELEDLRVRLSEIK